MARRKVTLHEHHRRWGMWTALVLFIAAGSATVVAFARADEVDREPWGYIALAVAILTALAGLLLAFAQAAFESQDHHDEPRNL
jgi:peptidoglycan/LPS O-acetylase OafA/YrhL